MDVENIKSINDLNEYMEELEIIKPVFYDAGTVYMLDQTLLPFKEKYISLNSIDEIAGAIKGMKTRGAGAIAASAAYGLLQKADQGSSYKELQRSGEILKATRPTASTLCWVIDKILSNIKEIDDCSISEKTEQIVVEIIRRKIQDEIKIAQTGADLLRDGETVLTHCHAGAIAGIGYGGVTLGIFREVVNRSKDIHVYATETRPYLQGARITTWELKKTGIPATLITDNMSGYFMQKGEIDRVIVGADRVTANGDVANKVGTYLISLAAHDKGIPVYVGVSRAGIDLNMESGDEIPIEMRDPEEVTNLNGRRIATPGIKAEYPAFDITPHKYISGFITSCGLIEKPFKENIKKFMEVSK